MLPHSPVGLLPDDVMQYSMEVSREFEEYGELTQPGVLSELVSIAKSTQL